jgi:hypothetical protein
MRSSLIKMFVGYAPCCMLHSIIHFMKQYFLFTVLSISLIASFTSCTKDAVEQDPTLGLTKVATGYAAGAATKVEVYSNAALTSGYQKFWFALYDSVSGTRVAKAHIKLTPMMDMGTMKHSAPFENPASENAVNNLFEGSVFFIMSSMGGTWSLNVNVHNQEINKGGNLSISLTVAEPAKKRMLSFTSAIDNTTKYFVGLVEPSKSKVGINNLQLVVFKKVSMMSFPADSSLAISFVPEMPTMGHSSPNNVNPFHTGKGHYQGKVNFTMTGLWRLHFDFKAGDTMAKSDSLDVEF